MKDKTTLAAFFEGEPACIHIHSQKEAINLCNAFHAIGKKWCAGESYLDVVNYGEYQNETVYYNDCSVSSKGFAEKHGYKIYEYDEIDWSEYESI